MKLIMMTVRVIRTVNVTLKMIRTRAMMSIISIVIVLRDILTCYRVIYPASTVSRMESVYT